MSELSSVLSNMNLLQLRDTLSYINGLIDQKSQQSNHEKSGLGLTQIVPNVDVNDYVEYHGTFCQDESFSLDFLEGELDSLNFKTSSSVNCVQNRFISVLDEPYTWGSSNGPVINEPLNISNFPVIKSLLDSINLRFNVDLNSVLVSYYRSGVVNTRLHDDGEDTMNQDQPICVLSVGAERKVEFFSKHLDSLIEAQIWP